MIHPTAVIHPNAVIHESAEIGPYVVIDELVSVGADCVIGPHAYLTGKTSIGTGNRFHAGCVIGDAPQDLKYKGEPTSLRIGDSNVFREHVTIHRSTTVEGATVLGSNNFLMANTHIGHNTRIGNHVILANGALLAGHVNVDDRVFISGNCLVHQFVRIGTLALMQGGAGISKDLPPFAVAMGDNTICGLNTVGLKRAGLSTDERRSLKALYHCLFRRTSSFAEAIQTARLKYRGRWEVLMINFAAASKRGLCSDVGRASCAETPGD